ncbi:MAG: response regulator [Deltaproteobacteria bacterium]|nr:response regulator [Deltaproteobacteria bacterium]
MEEEWRQKADALAKANSELDHFAAVASHDLKSPVRTVANSMRLLQRQCQGQLGKEADELIEFSVESCVRMQQLIDGLLKSARVTESDDLKAINLQEVVTNVLEDLRDLIQAAGARISVGDLPTVVADRVQMAEVFQNLIGNALKYRGDNGPEVTLGARRGQSEWILFVRDNGIGIPTPAQQKIFSSFVRLHSQEKYEGAGIGLATCKKVVEKRGGRIWVDSQVGQGSLFQFTIPDQMPLINGGVLVSKKGETAPLRDDPPRKKPKTFELLVVEDSPADSNIIETLIRKDSFPFRIHVVKDGEEALGYLKQVANYADAPRPDLILLDLNLPKLDGVTVLKEIKTDPELRSIPVIILSSSAREDDIRSSYESSAACYVRKPRDLEGYRELMGTLRRFWFDRVELPAHSLH